MMENTISRISVWGDSILKGAVTGTGSGHLFDIVEDSSLAIASRKLGFELNNQSVFGSIITKSQRRMNRDLERGIECDLGIIESGGNDCDYDWTAVSENPDAVSEPRVPLSDFMRILDEMVQSLRAHKITPLVMTMPPLVPDRWFAHICANQNAENVQKFVRGVPDKLYRNHELYSLHIVKYCYEKGVQFVDMRMAMLEAPDYRELMCLDGIHPNEKGYQYMAEVWERDLPRVRKEF
ncbi:MAG: SGNH/GDSL hydrolase family protein [Treponemataceae bacterium]|nr:SGNH/GDSL hydrolase family protein [Treponemataceae bacterium]